MSQAARHALRNTQISRSTVSKKIKVLDGSINEVITRLLFNWHCYIHNFLADIVIIPWLFSK